MIKSNFTSIDKYGVKIKAKPAATLHAPTPAFLIAVGYISAVYTGIIVLAALTVNFPVIKFNIEENKKSIKPKKKFTNHNKSYFQP